MWKANLYESFIIHLEHNVIDSNIRNTFLRKNINVRGVNPIDMDSKCGSISKKSVEMSKKILSI